MKVIPRVSYSQLSSVAWVSRGWVAALFVLVLAINLVSGLFKGLGAFWYLFSGMVLVAGLLAYPYYHYRVSGGFVKRIPPRFVTEKPVFVQMYT